MASCAPKSLSSASSVDIGARKTLPEDPGRTRPELRVSATAAQTRMVSVARIRLDPRKSVRPFKGIFCTDISEFESYMPSQPVRSPPTFAGGPAKSARIGPIRRIGPSLRVPDRATKASFRLSVSEGHFWYLVFERCGCGVKNSNEHSRPLLYLGN